tara:strand:- start:31 stop:588 length:558 start_codon:yes stop_codon:yes gene_type:complete
MGIGIGVVMAIGGIASAGVEAYSMVEQNNAAAEAEKAQEEQLRMQGDAARTKGAQDAVARDQKLKRIMAQQEALGAAHHLTGATQEAISDDSFNQFAKETKAENFNVAMAQGGVNASISSLRSQLHAQQTSNMIHGITGIGGSIFGGISGMKKHNDASLGQTVENKSLPTVSGGDNSDNYLEGGY